MTKGKSKRYLSEMTNEEKQVYRKEFKKAKDGGVDKWSAIRFARSMAKHHK